MERFQSPRRRVVLIGASNLVLGRAAVLAAARRRFDGALEILVAAGHGRSYGLEGRVLGRTLPPLLECGLWSALERGEALSTHAIVTDVGNDIAFGASPRRIGDWVEAALERLQARGAEIVVTGLPLASMRRLPPWQFRLFASALFPLRGIERERALADAAEVDRRLDELVSSRGLTKRDPQLSWYDRDPIHIAARARSEAWSTYTAAWSAGSSAAHATAELSPLLGRAWYAQVRLFGRETGRAQPTLIAADGTSVSFY